MLRELNNDLMRGWCLCLLEEFRRLQIEIPALDSLKPANIIIDSSLSSTLGYWDESTRRIVLAEHLFIKGNSNEIMDVFKHEIAHQLVSELFGIEDAMAHGEAFKRACGILDIPARSCADLFVQKYEAPSVIRRIKKLMALGDSSNKNEAELALSKAREISLKYNLDEFQDREMSDYHFQLVGKPYKRVPSYIWSVCGIVTRHYFTHYICNSYRDEEQAKYQMIELYGLKENLDLAVYVYNFLINRGELEWLKYKEATGLRNQRAKLSFLTGLYQGFDQKLKTQNKKLEEEQSLIWLGDPKLDAFFKKRNPRVRSSKVKSKLREEAHSAGSRVGQKLSINPAINKGQSNKQIHS